jgi:hypothetical protein
MADSCNITIFVDSNPGGHRTEHTRYDITRDTEDEAAIAALAILVAIYGRHLKTALTHISQLLAHFQKENDGSASDQTSIP